jgi:hypothetical protein
MLALIQSDSRSQSFRVLRYREVLFLKNLKKIIKFNCLGYCNDSN